MKTIPHLLTWEESEESFLGKKRHYESGVFGSVALFKLTFHASTEEYKLSLGYEESTWSTATDAKLRAEQIMQCMVLAFGNIIESPYKLREIIKKGE